MVQASHSVSVVGVLATLILVPAPQVEADAQPTALVAVEYFPLSQSVHWVVSPRENFPMVQASHSVSVVGVIATLILVPAPQVEADEQPTAPVESEYLPLGQLVQVLAAPMEKVPAAQFSMPDFNPFSSTLGLEPAGAVLQTAEPSTSENSPAPEHAEHDTAAVR